MGDSPKWVKSRRRRKKKERLNDGNNNGQATHGARKPPGPKMTKMTGSIKPVHVKYTQLNTVEGSI